MLRSGFRDEGRGPVSDGGGESAEGCGEALDAH